MYTTAKKKNNNMKGNANNTTTKMQPNTKVYNIQHLKEQPHK